jgi:hypothetical protein
MASSSARSSPTEFAVHVDAGPGGPVVVVRGEIDLLTAGDFGAALDQDHRVTDADPDPRSGLTRRSRLLYQPAVVVCVVSDGEPVWVR